MVGEGDESAALDLKDQLLTIVIINSDRCKDISKAHLDIALYLLNVKTSAVG